MYTGIPFSTTTFPLASSFSFIVFAPAFRPYVMGHPTRSPRRIRSAAGIKKAAGGSLLDKFDCNFAA
ncbi:hypothetical protein, partial [Enterobacter hormaechei]|uniref:hypothetical protein n=1 Tax=Enterobacter hormaechei TaxID=158836 RepID=UPI00402A7676